MSSEVLLVGEAGHRVPIMGSGAENPLTEQLGAASCVGFYLVEGGVVCRPVHKGQFHATRGEPIREV